MVSGTAFVFDAVFSVALLIYSVAHLRQQQDTVSAVSPAVHVVPSDEVRPKSPGLSRSLTIDGSIGFSGGHGGVASLFSLSRLVNRDPRAWSTLLILLSLGCTCVASIGRAGVLFYVGEIAAFGPTQVGSSLAGLLLPMPRAALPNDAFVILVAVDFVRNIASIALVSAVAVMISNVHHVLSGIKLPLSSTFSFKALEISCAVGAVVFPVLQFIFLSSPLSTLLPDIFYISLIFSLALLTRTLHSRIFDFFNITPISLHDRMSFLRTATHRLSFALVLHFVGRSAMILSDGLCAASVNTGAVQMSVDSISIASCSSAWVHALTDLAASFSTLGNLFVLYTVLRIVNPAVQSSTPVVNLPKLVVEQNTAAPEWTVSRSARSSVVDMPNTVSQDVLFPVPRQPERSLADSAVPPRSPRMTTGHVVPTSPRSHIDRPIPNPSAAITPGNVDSEPSTTSLATSASRLPSVTQTTPMFPHALDGAAIVNALAAFQESTETKPPFMLRRQSESLSRTQSLASHINADNDSDQSDHDAAAAAAIEEIERALAAAPAPFLLRRQSESLSRSHSMVSVAPAADRGYSAGDDQASSMTATSSSSANAPSLLRRVSDSFLKPTAEPTSAQQRRFDIIAAAESTSPNTTPRVSRRPSSVSFAPDTADDSRVGSMLLRRSDMSASMPEMGGQSAIESVMSPLARGRLRRASSDTVQPVPDMPSPRPPSLPRAPTLGRRISSSMIPSLPSLAEEPTQKAPIAPPSEQPSGPLSPRTKLGMLRAYDSEPRSSSQANAISAMGDS